jgi:hypothetical protein
MPVPTLDRSSRSVATHLCHACGLSDRDGTTPSFVYRRDASFCLTCWETQPSAAIQHVVQAVSLCSVPL